MKNNKKKVKAKKMKISDKLRDKKIAAKRLFKKPDL